MEVEIVSCSEHEKWNAVLKQCYRYDFYHLAEYHLLYQKEGQGTLIVISEGDKAVALPLLIRRLDNQNGLSSFSNFSDATSVYGYAGPVSNVDYADTEFIRAANECLSGVLKQQNIISVFSRLHPILQNDQGLNIGDVCSLGETVSIDLTLSDEDQFHRFRKSHRYDIRKARSANITIFHDTEWNHLSDFVALYLATMKRVNANQDYYFDQAYFDSLRAALGNILHLFVAKQDDKVISGALITLVNGIAQYHFSGSSPQRRDYAASKLVIDEARKWAIAHGATVFHLGGGLGAQTDSLFSFKSGFSSQRHKFKIWRFTVDPTHYMLAVQGYEAWLSKRGLKIADDSFFPLYRSPHKSTEQHS